MTRPLSAFLKRLIVLQTSNPNRLFGNFSASVVALGGERVRPLRYALCAAAFLGRQRVKVDSFVGGVCRRLSLRVDRAVHFSLPHATGPVRRRLA